MKRPRDYQRKRVYDAFHELYTSTPAVHVIDSEDGVTDFIMQVMGNPIWRRLRGVPEIYIERRRTTEWSYAINRAVLRNGRRKRWGTIFFHAPYTYACGKEGWTKQHILHEMTHLCDSFGMVKERGHGPSFTTKHLSLLNNFMPTYVGVRMERLYGEFGIDYYPKKVIRERL